LAVSCFSLILSFILFFSFFPFLYVLPCIACVCNCISFAYDIGLSVDGWMLGFDFQGFAAMCHAANFRLLLEYPCGSSNGSKHFRLHFFTIILNNHNHAQAIQPRCIHRAMQMTMLCKIYRQCALDH
jgi:hypothetical protein